MSIRERSKHNVQEAIRHTTRDRTLPHNVPSARAPDLLRSGAQWAMVVDALTGSWWPRAHDLPMGSGFDSGGPYKLFRHTLRLMPPATPYDLAKFYADSPSNNALNYPAIPSDLETNTNLHIRALSYANIYPKYTMVLVARDADGHWWILDHGMRNILVQLGPDDTAFPISIPWVRVQRQFSPGYFLRSAPGDTASSIALTVPTGWVDPKPWKNAIVIWSGYQREYYLVFRDC